MIDKIRKKVINKEYEFTIPHFFEEMAADEIQTRNLAKEVLNNPPEIGYLTISNALQWQLQYSRVIQEAGNIKGIIIK